MLAKRATFRKFCACLADAIQSVEPWRCPMYLCHLAGAYRLTVGGSGGVYLPEYKKVADIACGSMREDAGMSEEDIDLCWLELRRRIEVLLGDHFQDESLTKWLERCYGRGSFDAELRIQWLKDECHLRPRRKVR